MIRLFSTAILIALALPGVASAHGTLLSSSPAAGASVAKPTKVTLTFSDRIDPAASGVDIVMTAMPGMADHPPMPIRGYKTSVEDRMMILTMPRALPAGTYALTWHMAGADGHRVEGRYSFMVK